METTKAARSVKDVSPHEFVKAYAAHLKRSGKVNCHMDFRAVLAYLLVCYLFFYCKWVEGYRKLSKEEDWELEEQLKRLNKPAVKTIKTKHGVIYDCVDFYKQPAFDHPLLKNHSFHPEMRSTSIRGGVSTENEVPKLDYKQMNVGLEGGGCPTGMVPIRRTTKDDLLRAKFYSEMQQAGRTQNAGFQTTENIDYDGVGGELSVWNLPAKAPQYTSGRIKITNGAESIEAGWTVNPVLYGDGQTHLYIFTNAGQSHCFNSQCGFVQVRSDIPVDQVLYPTSTPHHQSVLVLSIYQDVVNKNWFLKVKNERIDIGFWPSQIFTNLENTATQAEWGGEIFTPQNVQSPQMGSGRYYQNDPNVDAFVAFANIVVNNTITNPPNKLKRFVDAELGYYAVNGGNIGGDSGYLMYYGGPGGF